MEAPPGFVREDDLPEDGAPAATGADMKNALAAVGGPTLQAAAVLGQSGGGAGPPPGFVPEAEVAAVAPEQEGPAVESPGLFKGTTQSMLQGFTFGIAEEVGAAGTATGAALKNWVAGKPANWVREYERAVAGERASLKAFEKEHPVAAVGGEVLGGVASVPGLGAKFIAKGASGGARLLRSAPVGAGTGGVYGAGRTSGGLEERAKGAALGAGTGAVAGPVFQVGAAGVAKVIMFAARAIPNSATAQAATKVGQALWRDNITVAQAKAKLRKLGAEGILADIAENTRNLAGAAARVPGKTRDVAQRFLNQRQKRQHQRIIEATRKSLGVKGGYFKQTTDLMDARQTAAGPLYEAAYKANPAMMTPEISRILETPAGRKALRVAATKIRNDRGLLGKTDPEMTTAAREAAALGQMKPVKGGVTKGLKLRTLDYVKKALDDQITVLTKAGRRDDARIIRNLKNDLLREMDAADVTRTMQTKTWAGTPRGADKPGAYQQARRTYAGHSESLEALEKGRNFIKGDVEVTAREIADMTDADRAFFREGVNQKVTDMVKRKKVGADKVADLLEVPAMREKLESTFGSRRAYMQWQREMLAERKMNLTLQQLRGSQTAERLETASDFNSALIRDLAWGAKGNVFAQMRLYGHLAGSLKGPPREAVAEAIAPMFSNDRAEQQAFLALVKRLEPVAGAVSGGPPLLGQLAAGQAYRPELQGTVGGAVALALEQLTNISQAGQGGPGR